MPAHDAAGLVWQLVVHGAAGLVQQAVAHGAAGAWQVVAALQRSRPRFLSAVGTVAADPDGSFVLADLEQKGVLRGKRGQRKRPGATLDATRRNPNFPISPRGACRRPF